LLLPLRSELTPGPHHRPALRRSRYLPGALPDPRPAGVEWCHHERGRAMQLGKLGVWAAMDVMSAAEGAAFAQRVEGWGYAALWLPESGGRNVLVHSSWLLANTRKLIVAPGVANIYARDPMPMA